MIRCLSVALTILFLLGVLVLFSAPRSNAQEDRGQWFKSLRQPDNPTVSCCDISDCRVTERAEWRSSGWWVDVHDKMVPVPEGKIIYNRAPLPEGAVICHGSFSDAIFCFVPPAMGT